MGGKETKLLGHNGEHGIELLTPVRFEEYEVPDREPEEGDLDAGWEEVGEEQGERVEVEVKNLVIVGVEVENTGNEDYLKFDPYSEEATLREPVITFRIEDEGDPHRYRWTLWVRDTREGEWQDFATVRGQAEGPGEVRVEVNDPQYLRNAQASGDEPNAWPKQEGELREWGTYTFDLKVEEVDGAGNLLGDEQYFKSPYKLSIPATMPGVTDEEGHPRPGHDLYWYFDEQGALKARVAYYLQDTDNREATKVQVDLLEPSLVVKASRSDLPKAVNTPHLDIDLYTLSDDDGGGTYTAVFMAADKYGEEYRDHRNKRMLAVNDRECIGRHLPVAWYHDGNYSCSVKAAYTAYKFEGGGESIQWLQDQLYRAKKERNCTQTGCGDGYYQPERFCIYCVEYTFRYLRPLKENFGNTKEFHAVYRADLPSEAGREAVMAFHKQCKEAIDRGNPLWSLLFEHGGSHAINVHGYWGFSVPPRHSEKCYRFCAHDPAGSACEKHYTKDWLFQHFPDTVQGYPFFHYAIEIVGPNTQKPEPAIRRCER